MNILVTGGMGFIGSNFISYMLNKYADYNIVNLDLLTYAANVENLSSLGADSRHTFIKGDIGDKQLVNSIIKEHQIRIIVNFAAESHVDRSISDPGVFVKTNVLGTQVLLDAANENNIDKFVQISTDEVYGSLGEAGFFTEETPLAPNSPYSASKAGADLLVRAYYETFNLPINITRCSNNYGPYQFPEKLIPLMVTNALEGEVLPIYGDGKNIRDWLHVADHCSAIDLVIHQGKEGEVYNIGGNNEKTNNEIVQLIIEKLGVSADLITYVPDRLGHDRRYAIDSKKISKQLGWTPKYNFDSGILETIEWYISNRQWWESIKNGTYHTEKG
ncbi:dTDP-glucose 4,6-dehydratase [Bacillus sp. AGMB 02131]|uniref:dTDP-glucose 4,6-dehydratase n=1 Tax=Peribacillus faecalis TaxID=2772559 RepID=A0A927HAM6_9BACI|nr:dTDP-glucose 4,6-dehydratase [Peribacillus faecalis]MBD3107707.1 dTDP-glucose 4,6-dehydratase [Peribacillus faecalis]